MKTKTLISGLALALAFAPAAAAQNPNKPAQPTPVTPPTKPPTTPVTPPTPAAAITLEAKPSIIVFSTVTTLSGRLSGRTVGGVRLALFQDTTRPYGDAYRPSTLTATTDRNGRYSFPARPLINTSYRVAAATSPPVVSRARLVLVRMKVGIRVSDRTPRRGSRVRFSGSVFPAHDGRTVSIQKRSSGGSFRTVVRTKLRDAGTARSTYSRRLRIYRDGVYRVKVAGDADHASGYSRLKTIDVHG